MRRLRILLAGVVATGALGAGTGAASADRPARGDFCDFADEADEALDGGDLGDVDFSDPDSVQEAYANLADTMDEVADEAPRRLKKAFRTIANFYDQLADVDFSDPEEAVEAFVPTAKVTRALDKITDYLVDECGFDATGTDLEG